MPGIDNIHRASLEVIGNTIKTSRIVFLKQFNEYIETKCNEENIDPKLVKHQIIKMVKTDPMMVLTEFKNLWDKYSLADDIKTTDYILARFNKLDPNKLKLVRKIADDVIDLVPMKASDVIKAALNLLIEKVSSEHKVDPDEVRRRIIYIRTP